MKRLLALAAAGLALVIGAAVLSLLDPSDLGPGAAPSVWPSVLAGAGAALLLGAAWLGRRHLRTAMAARQARFGAFAAAYTLVVLVALAALAFLVERQGWRFDVTRDQRSSLEQDTLRVLGDIPRDGAPVEIFGFTAGGGLTGIDRAAAENELLPLFELLTRTSPRVQARLADASREPAVARALGIVKVPSVAVRWQSPDEEAPRIVRTDLLTERDVARAIEQVLLGVRRPAYVLNGHGELSPVDVEGTGGFFRAMMEIAGDNYEVRPLNLIEAGGVPDDASLLIVAGPSTDFVPLETAALAAFAGNGGRMLFLLGPTFSSDGRVAAQPVLEGWLRSQFGIELDHGIVCDLDGLTGPGADLRTLVLPPAAASPHPILRGRDRLLVMPLARPLRIADDVPYGVALETLLRSGQRSWAEGDTPARPVFDPADRRGPHDLAIAVNSQPLGQERAARLVVLGSQAFADNSTIPLAGNASFLLDAAAWLNGREAVLEARRVLGRDGTAVIPYRQGVVILLLAAAIPLVLTLAGVLIWWQRRRL